MGGREKAKNGITENNFRENIEERKKNKDVDVKRRKIEKYKGKTQRNRMLKTEKEKSGKRKISRE